MRFEPGWDPESPGSRFTRRPAIAIASRPGGLSVFDEEHADTGDPEQLVAEVIDREYLIDDHVLGTARTISGNQGRGASAWVPVVEWLSNSAGQGAVGVVVSLGLLRAGRRLRQLLEQLAAAKVRLYVSRGVAEALAVDCVVRRGLEPEGALDVEATVETAFLSGGSPTELNYVGADPWIVALVNADRTRRYVVGVLPDGQVQGLITLPIDNVQRAYLPLPPRDDGHLR